MDPGAVRHGGKVCDGTAHPGDVGLVGAIVALGCVIARLPGAIAADDEPLERADRLGRGGRLGCHRERELEGGSLGGDGEYL